MTGSFEAAGCRAPRTLLTPGGRRHAGALPEVDAGHRLGRRHRLVPARQGRQAGRRPGRPDPRLQLRDTPNHGRRADRSSSIAGDWPEEPGEITLDTGAAENGRLRGRRHGHDDRAVRRPTPTSATLTLRHRRLQRRRHGRRHAGDLLDTAEAQEIFLDGQDAFTSVALTAADGVSQTELAEAADDGGARRLRGGRPATRWSRRPRTQIGQFLDVISTFLIAFAVIAIVVGAFIIFNTFSILVSQRVREFALLRALGRQQEAGHPLGAGRGLR